MKFTAIFREATRDVSTGTSRMLFAWVVYTSLVSLLVLHELLTVTAMIDRAVEYQAAGANTRMIVADGRIDGAACEALSSQHAVSSAAMKFLPERIRASVMSSVPLDQYRATTGITEVLNARSPQGGPIDRAGALVSVQVTEHLGASTAPLDTDAGTLQFAGVFSYPDDGRRAGLGFAAIYPTLTHSEPYDQCWVTSWPENPDTISLLNSVVIPATEPGAAPPEIAQWNATLGASFEGHRLFQDRISQFNPYLALLAGGVLSYFTVRSRRLEVAAARHAGVTPLALMGIQYLQQLVWILLGGALALLGASVIGLSYPDSTHTLLALTFRTVGLATLGALCGIGIATLSVRERALFVYFQNRN